MESTNTRAAVRVINICLASLLMAAWAIEVAPKYLIFEASAIVLSVLVGMSAFVSARYLQSSWKKAERGTQIANFESPTGAILTPPEGALFSTSRFSTISSPHMILFGGSASFAQDTNAHLLKIATAARMEEALFAQTEARRRMFEQYVRMHRMRTAEAEAHRIAQRILTGTDIVGSSDAGADRHISVKIGGISIEMVGDEARVRIDQAKRVVFETGTGESVEEVADESAARSGYHSVH